LPRSRGFINSFDTKAYHTFVNHFDSRGLIGKSSPNIYFHYYDYIDYTTPRKTEDLVTSIGQEGLGEHVGGPATPDHEVFLPSDHEKA